MIETLSNIQYCYDYVAEQISLDLLLYAHIPTSLIALAFSIFILYKKKSHASISLFLVALSFTLWCLLSLNSWFVFIGSENMMFNWSLIDIFGLLFFLFSYNFLYAYITTEPLPRWQWWIALILIIPTFITTFFGLNLLSFDLNECGAVENENIVSYAYYVQFIFALASLYLGVSSYRKTNETRKKTEIVLATIGVLLFLGFFVGISFLVSFLINYTSVANPYNYEIYGLFGMPVLLMFLGYLIVRYKAFDIRLVGAQALVVTLCILIGAQVFFATSTPGFIVNGITLALVLGFGFILVKSVKKEVALREQIEGLVVDLDKANERLKELDKMKSEFVSIASHQLRSPLTSIRGYASMLAEGSYGKMPPKVAQILEKIAESSKFMALSIEDYLNVSRIEAGNMKYEMSDFNLSDIAEKIVDELRSEAIKKGLVMIFRSDYSSTAIVNADIGKTRQIIMNLLDNSMKYTPKGTITVLAHDDVKKKKMYITIQDTGVGMSKDTQSEVFDKFVRAKNANNVNVTGTGLGLFVAKKMITDMNGRVWAESEGEGMGSKFHIELPLISGKPKK